jgi:hypothetical protein
MNPDHALHALVSRLRALKYSFTTPTPLTHARVLARKDGVARDLRDVFGWSLPFHPAVMPEDIIALLEAGRALTQRGDLLASTVRVSTLGEDYFLHSAYPTDQQDAVFFGPDKLIVTLGYAGWSAGQLEHELTQNAWLTVEAKDAIIFDLPSEERLPAAMELLGVDFARLADSAGHA